ncbi:ABC transporter permease [Syntrophotalea acetylenica]|jgi:putative ABC transport system permease protein|uniref:ABC transporter permease n=1 Tax=Syntrophotalea acetylenica TaxID=29542 RepID=A0A1L3GF92_SYNAC|nr:ABC transporter permease [Syntrophotalea acetylenica]APG24634.1 ABC transporter permease [Syntrophotalea acetylenica]APG45216.1 ABC transporter permease [Syntrophotalea acetylenica]MDY0262211.1 ABC transporter permease [Syntrophotalea acetylenica]
MLLSIKIALASLRAHRLRTLLAMLGVMLGALALTGVQHISRAMLLKAEQETAKLGSNLFMARTGQLAFRPGRSGRVRHEATTFTLQDARDLARALPAVRKSAPFVSVTLPIRSGNLSINCQLVATWPDYRWVRNAVPEVGRFLSAADENRRARVCVLGASIARRLFGRSRAALGQPVFFHRAMLRVVGVMQPKGADIAGADQDEQVFVPMDTYLRRMSNQTWLSGVYLQLGDEADISAAKQSAAEILRRNHRIGPGEEDDFSVLTAKDTMEVQQQALNLVGTLGLISSSVSFTVGGLGILSIMVLLVRARRLEIGVRRAVGARRRDIVGQFLLEAAMMAMAGGLSGVGLALGLVLLVCRIGGLPYVFEPSLVLLALAGSALLGLVAGAYPAWQAAQVEILEVLKSE